MTTQRPVNPARDLAATGTPGPWEFRKGYDHVLVQVGSDWPNGVDEGLGGIYYEADAEKIRRAVNALPAIADLLDALAADDTSASEWWKRTKAARDAVAAALTGETP